MEKGSDFKEKRRGRRVQINLPLNFQVIGPEIYLGMALDASETGLFIQTVKEMKVGTKVRIVLSLPEGAGRPQIDAIAEIIWKEACLLEDWEGFQYGLKFIQISAEDDRELKQVLNKLL